MRLTSKAFEQDGFIPQKFTCEGDDINPQFDLSDIPRSAQSLALIAEDPDAPTGTFVHWVLYDLPVTDRIPENSFSGGVQGFNDFGRQGYGGPCPPSGTHRYFFKVYALDNQLNLDPGAGKEDLMRAMSGHIIEEAELMGRYRKRSG